ncbi:MAG: CNNM domain-containing protein [Candidatus Gorgyraea atricola]|nr:CNNM domain-containing protein [Candidatus Gorgyraea atricola]
MLKLIILIIGILFASGLCSMVEAAILSLPLVKARILFDKKRKGSKDLLFIKENIHIAIATIVVLNNSVNIVGAIFVGRGALKIFGNEWLAVISAVLTFLIIVISEVIPKTIGEYYKVRVSLSTAKILRGTIWVLSPLIQTLIVATGMARKKSTVPKVTEEEIKAMLRLGRDAGTVEVDEEKLCNKVFKLNDMRAAHIMKPIDQIYALPGEEKLIEAKDSILNSQYSRIAVYNKDVSNIIGICQQRVLLREIAKDNYEARIKDFMSRPIFVNENEKADDLLTKFQAYHQHLFIVQDKEKLNIGIVSMEDVLEELFGEIYDEKDKVS